MQRLCLALWHKGFSLFFFFFFHSTFFPLFVTYPLPPTHTLPLRTSVNFFQIYLSLRLMTPPPPLPSPSQSPTPHWACICFLMLICSATDILAHPDKITFHVNRWNVACFCWKDYTPVSWSCYHKSNSRCYLNPSGMYSKYFRARRHS